MDHDVETTVEVGSELVAGPLPGGSPAGGDGRRSRPAGPAFPATIARPRAWGAGRLLAALLVLVASPLPARSAEAPATAAPAAAPRTGSQVGSLHRVAAVLESTLDVHRLALVELVAASRKILEAGQRPDATPDSPLPAAAAEVLGRLATSVPARVPSDALPAVSRAYEAEAAEALGDLGRAERLAAVAGPLREYVRSLGRLLGGADEVIDLYSRARPLETRVVDPDFVLDDINEALDELARAEAGVSRVRKAFRSNGEQLQAFMRLELALGHALDLIAEAQEAGIHIGFEAPLSTVSLASITKAVRTHLGELTAVLESIEKPPAPLGGRLEAVIGGDGAPYEARITWQAPDPALAPAALRVYRVASRREAAAFVASRLACESADPRGALEAAERRLEGSATGSSLVRELPPGRASVSETLDDGLLYAAPRYRVVPVTAFGIEGTGPGAHALYLPRTLEAPPVTTAALTSRNAADPGFYAGGDRVEVRWEPSRSEIPASALPSPDTRSWIEQQKLPVARRYRVVRLSGGKAVELAVVPATVHELTDRPPWDELGRGVSYVVESISDGGRAAQGPAPCRASEVQADVAGSFREAAAGIAYLRRPTRVERARLQELAKPEVLNAALAAFAARPADERNTLLEAWWNELSPRSRTQLLSAWPQYVSKRTELDWLLDGVDHLSARDRPWVTTELWLATQPPYMQREVDRWWGLLDSVSRREALARWRSTLDQRHARWVANRLAVEDESVLRPAKVVAWWSSRDAGERERIDEWWADTPYDQRRKLYREWLADQPVAVKVSVRWPDWARRPEAERDALLGDAYRELPDGLLIHVLAWLPWHELRGEAREAAIAAEVGSLERSASRARYALRPLDRALGFHLWAVTASIVVLLPIGAVVYRSRRKRQPRIRR